MFYLSFGKDKTLYSISALLGEVFEMLTTFNYMFNQKLYNASVSNEERCEDTM